MEPIVGKDEIAIPESMGATEEALTAESPGTL